MDSGGGGGGGGTTTQTVQQNADPWGPSQRYLNAPTPAGQETNPIFAPTRGILQEAANLYQNQRPQVYGGATVAPQDYREQLALGLGTNLALQPSPLQTAGTTALQDILSGNKAITPAYASTPGLSYNAPAYGYQDALQSAIYGGGSTAPFGYGGELNKAVTGGYLAQSNPYLPQIGQEITRQSQAALAQTLGQLGTRSQVMGHGADTGSTAGQLLQAKAIADSQTGLAGQLANLYGNAYSQERQLQNNALNLAANMYESGAGRGLQGLNLASDIYNTDANRMLQAALQGQQLGQSASLSNAAIANQAQQQNIANLLSTYPLSTQAVNQQWGDIARLSELGTGQRTYQQSLLDEALRKYEAQQNLPWQTLSNYQNLLRGTAGLGGTSTGTTTGMSNLQGASTGQRIMGGLLGGAGLGYGGYTLANAAGLSNPLGWGIGAGLLGAGLMGGLFD